MATDTDTTVLSKDETVALIRRHFDGMRESFLEDAGGWLSQVLRYDEDVSDADASAAIAEIESEWRA